MTLQPILHSKPWLTAADAAAIRAVIATGMIAQGPVTAEFESATASWLGRSHAVATASGGGALLLALRSLGCGPGREVILPTYVCRTLLDAVLASGAAPVLCDVGPSWLMRPVDVAPFLTERTTAVIVPHLYGLYADVTAIRALGVPVIEDAAQAFGSSRPPEQRGDLTVLSFHPTKCLTTGEGGMVLTDDEAVAARLRSQRDGGPAGQPRVFAPLPDTSAALGLSQLRRYPEFLSRRALLAERYRSALSSIPSADLSLTAGADTMHFRFPLLRAGGLATCQAAFLARGIHVRRGVDHLLHHELGLPDTAFPHACRLFASTVSLPLYPALTEDEFAACLTAAVSIFGDHE